MTRRGGERGGAPPALLAAAAALGAAGAAMAQRSGAMEMSWGWCAPGGLASGGGFGLAGSVAPGAAGVASGGTGLAMVAGGWGIDLRLPGVTLRHLRDGSNRTLRLLYLGNSRVARPSGFAFDGVEDIIHERGRLAGNGFVTPLYGAQQSPTDTHYLFNTGESMTPTTPSWWATDAPSELHAHNGPALLLIPGRRLKMANLGNDVPLLPRTEPVELTVQHLLGPDRGVYRVVPIEVLGDDLVVHAHPATEVSCGGATHVAGLARVVLPPMLNPSLNRSFLLEGVAGQCTVFAVNAERDAPGGVSVSEMAVGGEGYDTQAREDNCPAASWTAYAAAFRPDVVLWQYAGNQGPAGVPEATRVLMDRVASVSPHSLHVLLIDTPSPRSNTQTVMAQSERWAADVEGYRGAIVLDPRPYLPPDFTALAGTGRLGAYFRDPVHENRLGARTVADAVWAALSDFADGAGPPDPCPADCDRTTGLGVLDVFDFLCFQNLFAAAEPYACDCDTSTGPLACDVFDFLCFQNAYAAGCP